MDNVTVVMFWVVHPGLSLSVMSQVVPTHARGVGTRATPEEDTKVIDDMTAMYTTLITLE